MPKGIPGSAPSCSAEGCGLPNCAKGLCKKHYYRQYNGRPLDGPNPRPKREPKPYVACSVEGCIESAAVKGWCGAHYQHWRRHGDPTVKLPRKPHPPRAPRRSDGLKACTICGAKFPPEQFYRDPNTWDGRRPDCAACSRARNKNYARRNVASVKAYQAAYREIHREKAKARTAQYRVDNPDRVRAANASWRIRNVQAVLENNRRRKSRLDAATIVVITVDQLAAKFAYWGDRCWMCGGEATEADHVKPIARGGLHILANIRPACRSCNAVKSDRWTGPLAAMPRRKVN